MLCASLLLGTSAAAPPEQSIAPFTTDGCSKFPDRSKLTGEDWCHCCVVHDVAYWQGGSSIDRQRADEALRSCVIRTTGNEALAELMFAGVRAGGGPHTNASYRWGYGWPVGRGYADLSPSEQASAAEHLALYRATNPALACATQ
jgi:hypothetical protein